MYETDEMLGMEILDTFLPALWFLMAFNFFANTAILLIILKSSNLRRKATIMYIINGAVVNILFCVTVEGSGLILREVKSARQAQCAIYDVLFFFMSFVMVFTIASIALDKYFAVMKPFFYHQHDTKRTARILITCSWIFAVILSGPKVVTVMSDTSSRLCRGTSVLARTTSELVSEIITIVLVCLIPSIVIVLVYGRLFHRLWISTRLSQATDISLLKTRRKLTALAGVVTFLFVLCWMPYCVASIWWCLGKPLPASVQWCQNYASIFIFAYGGVSPLIYAFSNQTVLQEIKKCGCCICSQVITKRAVAPSVESRTERGPEVGIQ